MYIFDAEYIDSSGVGNRAEYEEMLMMMPERRASINGNTMCVIRVTDNMLQFSMSDMNLSELMILVKYSGYLYAMPTLFTSTCTLPFSAWISSAMCL